MSNEDKPTAQLSVAGEADNGAIPTSEIDTDQLFALILNSMCPMTAPLTAFPSFPTGTETVPSNLARMFSPKPEAFGINPYSSSLPGSQSSSNNAQPSNPSAQSSPIDEDHYIQRLKTSHVGLTSSQGPKPIVSMACCYGDPARNVEQVYNKRHLNQETGSSEKKIRIHNEPEATRNEEPKLPTKPAENNLQAASDSNLLSPTGTTSQISEAALTLTGATTVQLQPQSSLQVQSSGVLKGNEEQPGQQTLTVDQALPPNMASHLLKAIAAENQIQFLKKQLRMETRTEVRVFFKNNNKNDSNQTPSTSAFQFFLFNVTFFGNYDITIEDNTAEFIKKISSRLTEAKQSVQSNCAHPSASIALRCDGMDLTNNKTTTKISNASILSVVIDGDDKHIFGVVHQKHKTTQTLSIFSTYTRKTSLEIVNLIQKNIIKEYALQSEDIKTYIL